MSSTHCARQAGGRQRSAKSIRSRTSSSSRKPRIPTTLTGGPRGRRLPPDGEVLVLGLPVPGSRHSTEELLCWDHRVAREEFGQRVGVAEVAGVQPELG